MQIFVLVDGYFKPFSFLSKTKGCHLSLSNTGGKKSALYFCVKFDLMILWNSNVGAVMNRLQLPRTDLYSVCR